jgi:cell division protein FtsQ
MRSTHQSSQNRSEQVRQRRTQRSQQRVYSARSAARQPKHLKATASVQSRDAWWGVPLAQQGRSNTRRRVSVGMGNGAELVMRNLPVIRPGWRLLSFFLVVLLSAVISYTWNSPAYHVTGLAVKGNSRVSAHDIESVVNLSGASIFTIDPQTVLDQVKAAFPEVTDLSLQVSSPNKVALLLRERTPVVTWQYGKDVIWIDAEGAMFPPRGKATTRITVNADKAPPLVKAAVKNTKISSDAKNTDSSKAEPLLPALSLVDQRIDPKVLTTAIRFSTMLPKGTELTYSQSQGLGWTDPEGWDVFVGMNLDNIDLKMTVYKAIVKRLKDEGIKPVLVSLENVDTPYYRLEK